MYAEVVMLKDKEKKQFYNLLKLTKGPVKKNHLFALHQSVTWMEIYHDLSDYQKLIRKFQYAST